MSAEKLILTTNLNALQLTKDVNDTKVIQKSTNKEYEKVLFV